jgi:hypothetical protein
MLTYCFLSFSFYYCSASSIFAQMKGTLGQYECKMLSINSLREGDENNNEVLWLPYVSKPLGLKYSIFATKYTYSDNFYTKYHFSLFF